MCEELITQMRFCAEDHSVVECQDKCPNFGNYRPFEYCFSKLIAEAADAIEKLEEKAQALAETLYAYEHPWIPVTERLPEDEKDVLVCYGFVHDGKMSERRFIGALEYFAFDAAPHWQHESTGLTVTHWMPLPKPPTECRQMVADSNQVKEGEDNG